jgi:hypothetical protein
MYYIGYISPTNRGMFLKLHTRYTRRLFSQEYVWLQCADNEELGQQCTFSAAYCLPFEGFFWNNTPVIQTENPSMGCFL